MGGSASEEFLAPMPIGEDTFALAPSGKAWNVEALTTPELPEVDASNTPAASKEAAPDAKTIDNMIERANADHPRTDGREWQASDILKNVVITVKHPEDEEHDEPWREVIVVGVPGDRTVDMKRLEAQFAPAELEEATEEDLKNHPELVPEVESAAEIKLNSTKPFDEFNEAKALGIDTKPVFIGPYTFLKLARTPEATELELDKGLVNAVAAVYVEVLAKFNELGAAWVQLDEPYLVLDKEPGDVELFKTLYTKILSAKGNVKVLLNTYFGHIADVYETVNLLGFDGIGLDLNEGREENLEAVAKYGVASNTTIFAGVISSSFAEEIAAKRFRSL